MSIMNEIYNGHNLGRGSSLMIAGPCSVEDYSMLESVATSMSKNKVKYMRGGVFKPRTSPKSFQGLGLEGLKMFREVADKHKLSIVSEVMSYEQLVLSYDYIDVFQVGSRNMQNFELLKSLGRQRKPVILKRGFMSTIDEFVKAAEYISSEGNQNIILCERGIRTFETETRNTLDISAIALIKKLTSYPIIADLSHSLGRKDIILPIADAVLAAGADGIMVEVHPNPSKALSDSSQQLNFSEFEELVTHLSRKE